MQFSFLFLQEAPFIFLVAKSSAGLRDNPFNDTWHKIGTKQTLNMKHFQAHLV